MGWVCVCAARLMLDLTGERAWRRGKIKEEPCLSFKKRKGGEGRHYERGDALESSIGWGLAHFQNFSLQISLFIYHIKFFYLMHGALNVDK